MPVIESVDIEREVKFWRDRAIVAESALARHQSANHELEWLRSRVAELRSRDAMLTRMIEWMGDRILAQSQLLSRVAERPTEKGHAI